MISESGHWNWVIADWTSFVQQTPSPSVSMEVLEASKMLYWIIGSFRISWRARFRFLGESFLLSLRQGSVQSTGALTAQIVRCPEIAPKPTSSRPTIYFIHRIRSLGL